MRDKIQNLLCVQIRTAVSPTPVWMEACVGVTDGIICACAKMVSLGTSARCVSDFKFVWQTVKAWTTWTMWRKLLVFVTPKWRTRVYCNLVEIVASAGVTGKATTTVLAKLDTQAKTVRKVRKLSQLVLCHLCSSSSVLQRQLCNYLMYGLDM